MLAFIFCLQIPIAFNKYQPDRLFDNTHKLVVQTPFPSTTLPVIKDYTNDGYKDLVIPNQIFSFMDSGRIVDWRNHKLKAIPFISKKNSLSAIRALISVDFDLDGEYDYIFLDSQGYLYKIDHYFRAVGKPISTFAVNFSKNGLWINEIGKHYTFDINNDGYKDVLIALAGKFIFVPSRYSGLSIFMGPSYNRESRILPNIPYIDLAIKRYKDKIIAAALGPTYFFIAVKDINQTGWNITKHSIPKKYTDIDILIETKSVGIVLAGEKGSIYIPDSGNYLFNGTPTSLGLNLLDMITEDIDNDGNDEVIGLTKSNTIEIINRLGPVDNFYISERYGGDSETEAIYAEDVDLDGAKDIIISSLSDQLNQTVVDIYFNQGDFQEAGFKGQGTPKTNPPRIYLRGDPILGSTVYIGMSNGIPNADVGLYYGRFNVRIQYFPWLDFYAFPWYLTEKYTLNNIGAVETPLRIPKDKSLKGLTIYLQWLMKSKNPALPLYTTRCLTFKIK